MTARTSGLTREETNRALALLKSLERHSESYEFKYPVDYIGLGLPDYPEIIKYPMDLSTVKKNLNSGEYLSLQDFILDVQLIWDNCRLYNPSESFIAQQATRLQEFMAAFCTSNNLPLPSGKRKPKEPMISVQEKIEISAVVKNLSINTLAHITLMVQQECPEAFEALEKNKVKIILEKINHSTYVKIKE